MSLSPRSPRLALLAATLLLHVLVGCDPGDPSPGSTPAPEGSGSKIPVAPPADAGPGRVHFVDRAAERGIDFRHTDGSSGKYFITETLASGVAIWDYNADGRLDIYFPNGRMLPPGSPPAGSVVGATPRNALYEQGADGKFTDVTGRAGVPGTAFGVGCCLGDYDGDGDLDLYVCQYGANVLYRNEGDGTFQDVTAAAGVGDTGFGAGATFFDADGDADLDLYVTNYCTIDYATVKPCMENKVPGYCPPAHYPAAPDVFYRNDGEGKFTDISQISGILAPTPGRGMGVIATDLDDDGDLDIYVANDGSENFLLENRGEGQFVDVALEKGVALDANGDSQGCMGVDIGDVDLDGRPDIVVTNYQKQSNVIYRQEASGFYSDVSMTSRLGARSLPLVGWGTGIQDLDDDGYPDVFIANGHLEDQIHRKDQSSTYLQPNQLLINRGDGSFDEHTDRAGPGLKVVLSSRGAAFGDLDDDGDVDIIVSNSRAAPTLLMNETPGEKRWLGLHLVAKRDRFALNARARVHTSMGILTREVRSGGSYLSQNDLRLRFGLGAAKIEKIEITWPGGATETVSGVPLNAYSTVKEGEGLVR